MLPRFFGATPTPKTAIPVDAKRLKQDVTALASLSPARSFANPRSLERAADYITGTWRKLGLKPQFQSYQVQGQTVKNVRCVFGPKTGKRLVIGAHYDVCGDQPGADDNASGVAGLLELSRLLVRLKPGLRRPIELVAYTLEEPPFFRTPEMGSAVHAKSLHDARVDLFGMICLEMIGYFTDKPRSQRYPVPGMGLLYPRVGNFIAVVGNFKSASLLKKVRGAVAAAGKIDVQTLAAPSLVTGVDFSDHLNYWKYGYPAVMLTDTSFYRNHNYHQKSDRIDTLDFAKMAEVVKGAYWALVTL